MKTIAIVFFSGFGHTKKQAEAVKEGAESIADISVNIYQIDQNGEIPEESFKSLENANAIIYGTPTYMGGPAWQFKKFAELSSRVWGEQLWKDKIAAGFTNSASVNGDKFSTVQYLWTLSQQHGQIWVGTGVLPANKKSSGPNDINWTAGFSGALAISPSDASPDEAPRIGDINTAKLLGKRVALITKKLNA